MSERVNRVTLGSAPDLVTIGFRETCGAFQVDLSPARAPQTVVTADGSTLLIYGPGEDRRSLVISGTGLAAPDLSGLDLYAPVEVTIYWPDRTTTTLAVHTQGVSKRQTNMSTSLVSWSIAGQEA